MAYHSNVDTRAKVGFRPYHATDPFGAAHLSGYGSGLGRPQNPFDEENWVLHANGLGVYEYNRPFDPWELHTGGPAGLHGIDVKDEISALVADAREAAGRGDTITAQTRIKEATDLATHLQGLGYFGDASPAGVPAGSQITYTAQISASFNPLSASAQSLAATIAAVNAELQANWHVALLNWADNTPALSVGVGKWTVTLNLQNLSDYGSLADIKSVVDGAFYNAASATVASSSIAVTSLANPSSTGPATPIGTGTPVPMYVPPSSSSSVLPGFPVGAAAWLDTNWPLVLGAGVAVMVLPNLFGGRRR